MNKLQQQCTDYLSVLNAVSVSQDARLPQDILVEMQRYLDNLAFELKFALREHYASCLRGVRLSAVNNLEVADYYARRIARIDNFPATSSHSTLAVLSIEIAPQLNVNDSICPF